MEDGQQQGEQGAQVETTTSEPAKVEMTQARFEQVMGERLARQEAQFTQRLQSLGFESFDALGETVAQQRQEATEAEERRQARLEKEGKHADLLEIERRKVAELQKAKESEVSELRAEIAQRDARVAAAKVRNALVEAATVAKTVAPGQVADLLAGRVQHGEDGTVYVLGDDGKPRLNGSGQPVTVAELVAEFATSNPHFVAAARGTGGNSRPGGGPVVTPGVDLTRTDIDYIMANQDAFNQAALDGRLK